jgi:glycosyltransferase involved in cell wall biosynthesis
VPMVPRALWQDGSSDDPVLAHIRMHGEVFRRAAEFDVIHTHTEYFAFPHIAHSPTPVVTTIHGRVDIPDLRATFRLFPEACLVSISRAQRADAPEASWVGTVHHGLPLEDYEFDPDGGEDLVFLGRMNPEKAPEVAIDVAVAASVSIVLAGRIEPGHQMFFEREVRPRLDHPLVRYVGEVGEEEKQRLLRGARALLFPIDWPEPFGLVMAEAMACGTPVVARPKGAAPEVVVHGVTGFLADRREALVEAVRAVRSLERADCRRHMEMHFSVNTMTRGYEQVYAAAKRRARRSGDEAEP